MKPDSPKFSALERLKREFEDVKAHLAALTAVVGGITTGAQADTFDDQIGNLKGARIYHPPVEENDIAIGPVDERVDRDAVVVIGLGAGNLEALAGIFREFLGIGLHQ